MRSKTKSTSETWGRKAVENTVPVQEGTADLETAPPLIPEEEIIDTIVTDVVVVGAGLAGLAASVSAAQEGAHVILLEKGSHVSFRGYDYGAVGSRIQESIGNHIRKEAVVQEIMRWGGFRSNRKVVSLWADHSGKAIDWLLDLALAAGMTPKPVPIEDQTIPGALFEPYPTLTFVMEPSQEALAQSIPGWMPYTAAVAYTFIQAIERIGVDLRFNTPAVRLVRKGKGKITGIVAGSPGCYTFYKAKKGVILCTGDYGHDPEMVRKYIPSSEFICNTMYPGTNNTGDGHKMGLWIGAAMDDWPHAPMYFDFGIADHPHIPADALMRQPWLNVNILGERFTNEELPYAYLCNAMMQQPDHVKWSVWDSKWPEEAANFSQIMCKSLKSLFHDPKKLREYINRGIIQSADTLDDLARKMEVPVKTFKTTVVRYNELAQLGKDLDFGKRSACLTTIEKPPFYAVKMGTSLLVTLGGLKINHRLQVLDREKKIIPGLYAAGNVSGCYYGHDYPTTLPGNSHGRALTFGYLAGKLAAARKG